MYKIRYSRPPVRYRRLQDVENVAFAGNLCAVLKYVLRPACMFCVFKYIHILSSRVPFNVQYSSDVHTHTHTYSNKHVTHCKHVTNCKHPRRNATKHITHIKQLVKRNYCPRRKGLTLSPQHQRQAPEYTCIINTHTPVCPLYYCREFVRTFVAWCLRVGNNDIATYIYSIYLYV